MCFSVIPTKRHPTHAPNFEVTVAPISLVVAILGLSTLLALDCRQRQSLRSECQSRNLCFHTHTVTFVCFPLDETVFACACLHEGSNGFCLVLVSLAFLESSSLGTQEQCLITEVSGVETTTPLVGVEGYSRCASVVSYLCVIRRIMTRGISFFGC